MSTMHGMTGEMPVRITMEEMQRSRRAARPRPENPAADARSRAVFAFVVKYKREHDGIAPTLREIGAAVGISSSSVTNYHLNRLELDGLIRRPYGATRAIEIVGGYEAGDE